MRLVECCWCFTATQIYGFILDIGTDKCINKVLRTKYNPKYQLLWNLDSPSFPVEPFRARVWRTQGFSGRAAQGHCNPLPLPASVECPGCVSSTAVVLSPSPHPVIPHVSTSVFPRQSRDEDLSRSQCCLPHPMFLCP